MERKIFIPDPQGHARRAMSIAEFCQRYGTGRTTAYQEIKAGRLRARKCGKRTIITDDDAEAWLRDLPTIQTNPLPEGTPPPVRRPRQAQN
jgi:excisionase family DNA binding protein